MALLRPSVWTQQPQQACEIDWSNPITRGLVSAITPINGDVFKPSSPTFIGAGSIGPLTSGVAIKSTGGGGVNEVLYPVTFSAAGDRTIAVFASNIGGANSTVTHRVSDADSRDELLIGATSFSSIIDNNSPPSIGITESAMPRLYLARRRTNQVSAYANGTFTSESVTGTRQLDGTTFRFGRDGTLNSVSCQTYLTMYWKRYLTNAEITSLSNNPWQIFKPIPRRIFAPVSASGGATITTNLGTATASGLTATLTQASTLIATQGTATASGLSATLAQAFTLQANRGTATASGAQATIAQAATISANLGTATASGFAADVQSAGNVTISANIGIATASGRQANIGDSVTVSASRGTATAAGYTAAIEIAFTLAANRGTAQATGKTATIYASDVISASMGQGIASGYAALIVAGEIYARAPSGSGPVLVTQNKSRPVQTHATRYSNTGGIRR